MELATTVEFATAARTLSRAAQRRHLVAPSFRCPPRMVGADRTIRRRRTADGIGAVISVRVRGRPCTAVLADMIEGVVATNELVTPEADRLRAELWSLVLCTDSDSARPAPEHRGAA